MLLETNGIQFQPQTPKVLIVGDILLYREGVASAVAASGLMTVAATVVCLDALSALNGPAGRVDAVLVDASTKSALAIARAIRENCPSLPIIGFGIGGENDGIACAEAGMTGFVGRDGTVDSLIETVTQSLTGEVGCSPRFAAMLCARLEALARFGETTDASLTRRERQIAELVADGLSNKEIAIALRICPATVKNHIHSILGKFQVPRRSAIGNQLRLVQSRQAFSLRSAGAELMATT
jgi:two-component system, NarL family, nitrate/nitrite response regulator NarL